MILRMSRELQLRELDADQWLDRARAREAAWSTTIALGFLTSAGLGEVVAVPAIWLTVAQLVWAGLIG